MMVRPVVPVTAVTMTIVAVHVVMVMVMVMVVLRSRLRAWARTNVDRSHPSTLELIPTRGC
jgi:heme/copper-type cytochrome/quinol oxidase subunit 2